MIAISGVKRILLHRVWEGPTGCTAHTNWLELKRLYPQFDCSAEEGTGPKSWTCYISSVFRLCT